MKALVYVALLTSWVSAGAGCSVQAPAPPAPTDVDIFDAGDSSLSDVAAADSVVSDATADASPDSYSRGDVSSKDSSGDDVDGAPGDGQATASVGALGSITGACGVLKTELSSPQPSFYVSTYTFDAHPAFPSGALSVGAKKRYDGENAGGSSVCSEVMSIQMLADCDGSSLYKTENEVQYSSSQGAITDYIAKVDGQLVGVSVTRAYKGPTIQTYSAKDATSLLSKKLDGVNESSAKVSGDDSWKKQVLHIWTLRPDWVDTLKQSWDSLDPKLKADTVVWVTVEAHPDGQGPWIVPDACGL